MKTSRPASFGEVGNAVGIRWEHALEVNLCSGILHISESTGSGLVTQGDIPVQQLMSMIAVPMEKNRKMFCRIMHPGTGALEVRRMFNYFQRGPHEHVMVSRVEP